MGIAKEREHVAELSKRHYPFNKATNKWITNILFSDDAHYVFRSDTRVRIFFASSINLSFISCDGWLAGKTIVPPRLVLTLRLLRNK